MRGFIYSVVCVLICTGVDAQIELDYYPVQVDGIDQEDYRTAKHSLSGIYKRIKENESEDYSGATYWNVADAYAKMGVHPDRIMQLLYLSRDKNLDGFCAVLNLSIELSEGLEKNRFYKILGAPLVSLVEQCEGHITPVLNIKDLMKKKEELDITGLDEDLIDRLIVLLEKDQRYRSESISYLREHAAEQNLLDAEVSEEVVKIFSEYGYPGKDIVGDEYKDYACLLLEHTGGITIQEKYLPIVAEAYRRNQLNSGPLSMLLDRIYSTKTGQQVFGSHGGVPYATDIVIEEVKKKYGL